MDRILGIIHESESQESSDDETTQKKRVPYLIYPEDKTKKSWELFIGFCLVFTAIFIPL
jgi:hypothetical protein